MKAERINQDQVRFTLSELDLQERNLKVSELAYGSEKTKALFEDMMKTALDQFGVDFSEKPLMIEAIPVSDSTLTITVTRVSGAAELGALFGSNLPDGSHATPEDRRKQEGAPEKAPRPTAEEAGMPGKDENVIYGFKSFQRLCQAAAHLPQQIVLKNALYKDEKKGIYYLIVHVKKLDRRVRYVISVLTQYSDSWAIGEHLEMIIREHGRLVLKTRAMQKLAEMEQLGGSTDAGV